MPSEFSLIDQYFSHIGKPQAETVLGIGDDAAVVNIPADQQLVMSVDTLVAGVHFPKSTSASDIAHKSLVVNLSDLAAMAAKPSWFLLSLTLPDADPTWISEFAGSLRKIAEQYEIELIGGDTCQGPMSVTIQVNGLVEVDRFVTRGNAQVGDLIVVSGQLGNAALGLAYQQDKARLSGDLADLVTEALNRPIPRLCLRQFMNLYASAAIDLSDGLVGDLRHILDKSNVGANIRLDDLPVNDWIKEKNAFRYALNGGDDYELCLTVPSHHYDAIQKWNKESTDCPLSIIGEITSSGYSLVANGKTIDLSQSQGYQHFGQ